MDDDPLRTEVPTELSEPSDKATEVPVRIGSYKILGVLGSGGMGTVYLAEEAEPVRRQVALKVLSSGHASARSIARLEAERQALALMNHPSVATVYHAGTTEEGLPFFAMEVVRGLALLSYCDQQRLSLRERLRLFGQVCDAVQHAHQKMIIHRDLKPSNVLVAIEEGRPVPKLIDFGIAKCLEEPLTENKSLSTREGFPVGTPLYMSPEQIQGDLRDLDVRVDVYALGVLLYELLVGAQPFDVTRSEPIQVMMRVVKEDMPRPSVRFNELADGAIDHLVAARSSDRGKLLRELRGDLDWVVMKAIEKDRSRRYGSAAELGADVRRYLESKPVEARPPSLGYRVRRFVRRQKVAVISALVVLSALLSGLSVSIVASVRATRARDQAVASEQWATATVNYLRKVLSSVDPGVDGRQVRVVDLLTKASEMIDSDLGGDPEVEAAVRKTIGLTLLELGIFEESAAQLDRAVDLQEDVLGSGHPETLHSINAVARLLYKLGRYDEAATIHARVFEEQKRLLGPEAERTLWSMYHLAKAHDKNGSWSDAERLYRENLALRTRLLGAEHPDTLITCNSMSLFLANAGMLEEAKQLQTSTIEALMRVQGPQHPDTLRGLANMVEIHNRAGEYQEAETMAGECIESFTTILGSKHPETLGVTAQLAIALAHRGRTAEAEVLTRRVLALRRELLGEKHPDTIATVDTLAQLAGVQEKPAEAEALFSSALSKARESFPEQCWRTALVEMHFGSWLVNQARFREAEELLLASHRILATRHHPEAPNAALALAKLYELEKRRSEAAHYRSLAAGG